MSIDNDIQHILYVCTTCKAENLDQSPFDADGETQGEKLYNLIQNDSLFIKKSDLLILPTQCLSACKRGCAVALSSSHKYTYVFGEIDPTVLPDLSTVMQTYIQSKDGVLKKINRPESLQKKVVARVPPLPA